MRSRIVWFMAGAMFFAMGPVSSQSLSAQAAGTVTGRIVDVLDRAPVAAVQVFISSLDVGTLSQQNGTYLLLNVPAGTYTLTAQRIGYQTVTQEFMVAGGETVVRDFEVQIEALQLDEVIVTGTPGGTRRRALGNAVAQIDAAALVERSGSIRSMQEVLAGSVPGVNFTRISGNVGSGAAIQIRGVSSLSPETQPLVFVDGIRVNNKRDLGPNLMFAAATSALDDINPEDIESIEIVKGPSAATLYGTEASNGVIQIITKRGNTGAPQFEAGVKLGINYMQHPIDRIGDFYGNDLKTGELVTFDQGRNVYENELNRHGNEIFQNGPVQSYNMSVRGGTESVRYYAATEWSDEEGIVDYNFSEKLNLRANLDVLMSETVTLAISTGYLDGKTGYVEQLGWGYNLWDNILFATPETQETILRGFGRVAPEQIRQITSQRDYDHFTVSATLNHSVGDWLTHRLIVGLDQLAEENETVTPSDVHPRDAAGFVQLNRGNYEETTFDYSATVSYAPTGRFATATSVGFQYNSAQENVLETFGSSMISSVYKTIVGTTASTRTVNQIRIQDKSAGFYVQEQVSLDDRIFVTGALRADDHSAFGANFSAAYYPKVSGSWVISEESFWNVGFLSDMRLRGAWGKAGRQPAAFASVTRFDPAQSLQGAAISLGAVGNPDIGPEVSTEIEGGFDASFLNGRISGEFTYFRQSTRDALVERELSPTIGFSGFRLENIGQIDNWGWEARLTSRVLNLDDVALDLTVTADHVKNEIKDLGSARQTDTFREGFPFPVLTSNVIVSSEFDANGNPTNTMCDGGAGLQGRERGGATIPCGDREHELLIGHGYPAYKYSLNPTVTLYQDLQLYGVFEAEFGKVGYDGGAYGRHLFYTNTLATADRTNAAFIAGAIQRNPRDRLGYGYYDADWIRVRDIGARYQLPSSWAATMGADRASIAISGRNLWMIWRPVDEIEGSPILDPETGHPRGPGSDFGSSSAGAIPPLQAITVQMRVSF